MKYFVTIVFVVAVLACNAFALPHQEGHSFEDDLKSSGEYSQEYSATESTSSSERIQGYDTDYGESIEESSLENVTNPEIVDDITIDALSKSVIVQDTSTMKFNTTLADTSEISPSQSSEVVESGESREEGTMEEEYDSDITLIYDIDTTKDLTTVTTDVPTTTTTTAQRTILEFNTTPTPTVGETALAITVTTTISPAPTTTSPTTTTTASSTTTTTTQRATPASKPSTTPTTTQSSKSSTTPTATQASPSFQSPPFPISEATAENRSGAVSRLNIYVLICMLIGLMTFRK